MQKITNLRDLLVNEIKDLYDAEHRIEEALGKMAQKANSKQTKSLFEEHRAETRGHINRLEKVFDDLGEKPSRETCEATKGLIKEAEELMKESSDPDACDAALIASAQKVEHYEMAGYGSVRTWADNLGYDNARDLLQATLDEEGAANQKLTSAAKKINPRASN